MQPQGQPPPQPTIKNCEGGHLKGPTTPISYAKPSPPESDQNTRQRRSAILSNSQTTKQYFLISAILFYEMGYRGVAVASTSTRGRQNRTLASDWKLLTTAAKFQLRCWHQLYGLQHRTDNSCLLTGLSSPAPRLNPLTSRGKFESVDKISHFSDYLGL